MTNPALQNFLAILEQHPAPIYNLLLLQNLNNYLIPILFQLLPCLRRILLISVAIETSMHKLPHAGAPKNDFCMIFSQLLVIRWNQKTSLGSFSFPFSYRPNEAAPNGEESGEQVWTTIFGAPSPLKASRHAAQTKNRVCHLTLMNTQLLTLET